MITDYELGWFRYQTRFNGKSYSFRLYRIGSAQMGWLDLNASQIKSIEDDKVIFKNGLMTYILSFDEYQPGLYKTRFLAKLFDIIPYYSYRGIIGQTDKSKLLDVFVNCN